MPRGRVTLLQITAPVAGSSTATRTGITGGARPLGPCRLQVAGSPGVSSTPGHEQHHEDRRPHEGAPPVQRQRRRRSSR